MKILEMMKETYYCTSHTQSPRDLQQSLSYTHTAIYTGPCWDFETCTVSKINKLVLIVKRESMKLKTNRSAVSSLESCLKPSYYKWHKNTGLDSLSTT